MEKKLNVKVAYSANFPFKIVCHNVMDNVMNNASDNIEIFLHASQIIII